MGKSPCCSKESLKRGAWSAGEDKILTEYVKIHGEGKWKNLAKTAGLKRCGKSCRLRWLNYLRPDIKRGNITNDEEDLIIRLHSLLGNRWSLIAGRLPGRTDNEIKNYWNTNIGRKLQNGTPNRSTSVGAPSSLNPTAQQDPNPKTQEWHCPYPQDTGSSVAETKATRRTKVTVTVTKEVAQEDEWIEMTNASDKKMKGSTGSTSLERNNINPLDFVAGFENMDADFFSDIIKMDSAEPSYLENKTLQDNGNASTIDKGQLSPKWPNDIHFLWGDSFCDTVFDFQPTPASVEPEFDWP